MRMILPGTLLDHEGQRRPARVHGADEIGLDGLVPGFRLRGKKWSDGPLYPGRGDQYVEPAEDGAHAVGRRLQLLQVADVGADAERVSAGLFDFELRQVEFGLTARQQPHARAGFGEPHRQTFPDAPPGAGDQNALVPESS